MDCHFGERRYTMASCAVLWADDNAEARAAAAEMVAANSTEPAIGKRKETLVADAGARNKILSRK